MDADKSFGTTAVVELSTGPIFNVTQNTYYLTFADVTTAASLNDVIKLSTDYTLGGTTTGTAGVQVKLSSQWKTPDYTSLDATFKSPGAIAITNVAIIADGLKI
jgi:hypothetical protein